MPSFAFVPRCVPCTSMGSLYFVYSPTFHIQLHYMLFFTSHRLLFIFVQSLLPSSAVQRTMRQHVLHYTRFLVCVSLAPQADSMICVLCSSFEVARQRIVHCSAITCSMA